MKKEPLKQQIKGPHMMLEDNSLHLIIENFKVKEESGISSLQIEDCSDIIHENKEKSPTSAAKNRVNFSLEEKLVIKYPPKSKTTKTAQTKKSSMSDFIKDIFPKPNNIFRVFRRLDVVSKALNTLKDRISRRRPNRLKKFHYDLIEDYVCWFEDKKQKEEKKLTDVDDSDRKMSRVILKASSFAKNFLAKFNNVKVISPNSKAKFVWDAFILIMIYFHFFRISVELTFEINFHIISYREELFEILSLCVFMIDFLLKFNTIYYEDGNAVISREMIMKYYLKTEFGYDFLTLLGLFSSIYSEFFPLTYFPLLFFLQYRNIDTIFNNILQFLRFKSFDDVLEMILIIFKLACITHVFACLWHFIGYSQFISDASVPNWFLCTSYVTPNSPWIDRYLTSIYWSLTTLITVGYGDITPKNINEVLFCCITLLCGTLVFGYCVNCVGIIMLKKQEREKELRDNIGLIDEYMSKNNLHVDLKVRVQKCLEFIWKNGSKNLQKEQKLLQDLPNSLREEILLESHGKFLREFGILKNNFSSEFLDRLSLILKPLSYAPRDIIYSQKDYAEPSLYLLSDGQVDLIFDNPGKKSHTLIQKYNTHCYFGEIPFFIACPYQETAKSTTFSTIFKITRDDFLIVLRQFPNDYMKEKFCMIKDEILFSHTYEKIQNFCPSCKCNDHNLKRCPLITYQPIKSFLILKHNYCRPQKRLFFNRNPRTPRNALGDKKSHQKAALTLRFDKELMHDFKVAVNSPSIDEISSEHGPSINTINEIKSQPALESKFLRKVRTVINLNNVKKLDEEDEEGEKLTRKRKYKKSKTMNNAKSLETLSLFFTPSDVGLKTQNQIEASNPNLGNISPKEQRKSQFFEEGILKNFLKEKSKMSSFQTKTYKEKDEKMHQRLSSNEVDFSMESLGCTSSLLKLQVCKKSLEEIHEPQRNSVLSPYSICRKEHQKEREEDRKTHSSLRMSIDKILRDKGQKQAEPRNPINANGNNLDEKSQKLKNITTIDNKNQMEEDLEKIFFKNEEKNLFWNEFERMKNFKSYFIDNNATNIIMKRKVKKKGREAAVKSKTSRNYHHWRGKSH